MSWQVPPADSIRSRAVLENLWAWTVSFLVSSPRPRILTGTSLRVPGRRRLQRVEVDRRAVVEAALEVVQVDRLGVRPERLERHRHLLVRAAQLAHPHVDRVLAALEARALLGARARAVALLAAPGRSCRGRSRRRGRRACAACREPAGGLEVVEADASVLGLLVVSHLLLLHCRRDDGRAWTIPRSCGESSRSTDLPMPRRPSERSVSRCLPFGAVGRLDLVDDAGSRRRLRGLVGRQPSASAARPRLGAASASAGASAGSSCSTTFTPLESRARRRPTGRAAARSPPACAGPAGRRSSP